VDVWAVERLLGRAETAANYPELIRKAAGLYRGAFLDEREVELPQATAMVESLRRRLLRQLVRVGRQCEQANPKEAVDWYEDALRVDPCAEDVCRSLMTAYDRLKRSAEVVATYQRCRAALAARRGLTPSAATQGLFKALSAR
jgi:two-component SAPR family response regulator